MTTAEIAFLIAMLAIVHGIIMTISTILLDKDVNRLVEKVDNLERQLPQNIIWVVEEINGEYKIGYYKSKYEFMSIASTYNKDYAESIARNLNGENKNGTRKV